MCRGGVGGGVRDMCVLYLSAVAPSHDMHYLASTSPFPYMQQQTACSLCVCVGRGAWENVFTLCEHRSGSITLYTLLDRALLMFCE